MDKPELKKHATRQDLEEAKGMYLHHFYCHPMLTMDPPADLEQQCKVCGWKLLDYSDDLIAIAFTKDISMRLKRKELKLQGQDAVDISIDSDGQKKFGVFSSLILFGLDEIVKEHRWNVKRVSIVMSCQYAYTMLIFVYAQMMDKIGLYTKWATLMHKHIDNVGRRYWFKLEKIGDGSIKGSFEPVSMSAQAKFSVTIWIQPSDVMSFPAINLDNVHIHKNYGSARYGKYPLLDICFQLTFIFLVKKNWNKKDVNY